MKLKAAISGSVVSILAVSLLIGISQPAFAGCRDYPESITPECVAQNLEEEQRAAAERDDSATRIAQALLDAEARAREQAERDYIANGSRPCSLFPASITPECITENLAFEKLRQEAYEVQRAQALLDAEARAREQAERDYIANGSRPCTLFPASITPECVAENLEYEKERQSIYEKKQLEDLERAIKAEAAQQRADYIRNGSRPCTLFPASITPECATENLEYEEIRKVESAALLAAKEEATGASFNTKDENGSLLVVAKIPAKVDLLSTVVKLLNNKGKVIDTGVIRYQSSGEPYFVFDNFKGKGNFTVQMSLPKKKFSTLKIKVS
jgi:peroxiredoxin